MNKKFVGKRLSCVATLITIGGMPTLASATVNLTFTPLDNLLQQAALLQQNPLSRAHRQSPLALNAPADPDALYVQYAASDVDQLETADARSYTARHRLSISGGEYQLSPFWTAGARLGRLEQTLHFSDNRDALQHDANLASIYAQWFKNGFTAGSMLGYVEGEVEAYRAADGNRIQSHTDTEQTLMSVWGRYAFNKNGWVYGPFARLDMSNAKIDDLVEYSDYYTTYVEGRDAASSVFSMGVHAAYVFDVNRGKITPFFTLATRRQLRDKRDDITSVSEFEIMGWTTSITETQDVLPQDKRWHEFNVGLTIALDNRLQVTAAAEKALDLHQQDQEALIIRADWIFP